METKSHYSRASEREQDMPVLAIDQYKAFHTPYSGWTDGASSGDPRDFPVWTRVLAVDEDGEEYYGTIVGRFTLGPVSELLIQLDD